MSKPWGYVIRTPSERLEGEPRYYFSQDPFELKDKYYEGFNPVLECYIWKEPKMKPLSVGDNPPKPGGEE